MGLSIIYINKDRYYFKIYHYYGFVFINDNLIDILNLKGNEDFEVLAKNNKNFLDLTFQLLKVDLVKIKKLY